MKYKLICCDVDGTLLDNEANIPEENKKAIHRLMKEGTIFAICTGRVYRAALFMIKLLDIEASIVSNVGALVDMVDGEVLREAAFTSEEVKKIMEFSQRHRVPQTIFSFKNGIIQKSDKNAYEKAVCEKLKKQMLEQGYTQSMVDLLELHTNSQDEYILSFPQAFSKIAFWFSSAEERKLFDQYMGELEGFEITNGVPQNIEILPKGVSKWSGVQSIMERYGIRREEVVCIGDSMNDSDMIRHAGLGIAMGNAFEEVKAVADYVADTNENAGVAQVIYDCLSGKL